MLPRLPAPELSETDILKQKIEELERELEDARTDYETERAQRIAVLKNSPEVRKLYQMLRLLFDGAPVEQSASSVSLPRIEAIKKAFPGRCAELVDTLVAHGELNTTQIATIMRADPRTVAQLVYKLNKAGAIVKNGGKFSLVQ